MFALIMPRQAGNIRIIGTLDELTFYKMEGIYYVRTRSSLTKKRFFKDKAFEGSRRSCSRFGRGNSLASKVYRMVEKEKRAYALYCFLKSRAILLLKEGKREEEVIALLKEYLVEFGFLQREATEDTMEAQGTQEERDLNAEHSEKEASRLRPNKLPARGEKVEEEVNVKAAARMDAKAVDERKITNAKDRCNTMAPLDGFSRAVIVSPG